ncbi:MAG: N-methyl-L-tryptophan oxidase [Desulfobacterales bacterium]|jgi:sarcosine oxidase
MTASCDAVVVGLGAAGAAAAMEMARRGGRVVGLDAFRPPHDRGSHHGQTRSIRRAYLEGTAYVPMAVRAWALWRKLEADVGKTLLVSTPNLTIGPDDAPAVSGFFASAKTYRIPFEALTAADVRRRWPQLNPPGSFAAGLELEAGILFPERCIAAMLSEAENAGADLHFEERAVGWEEKPHHVAVTTETGRYEAGRLLLAAGARNKALLGEAGRFLSPKRVPVHWVAPPDGRPFSLGTYPVNFWQVPKSEGRGASEYAEFYSLPAVGETGRVKAAMHNGLADCDPDAIPREVNPTERETIAALLEAYLPALAGGDMESRLCLYTLTPDGDFILGSVPGHDRVFTAALAGHGFKFAPVLGEMLADMLQGRPPAFDTAMFSPGRFG